MTRQDIPEGFEIEEIPAEVVDGSTEAMDFDTSVGSPNALEVPDGFEIEEVPTEEKPFTGRITDYGNPSEMSAEQIKKAIDAQRADGLTDVEIEEWLREWGAYPDRSLYDYLQDPEGKDIEKTPDYDIGVGDAMWKGLQSAALRGYDDEIEGFFGAVGNKIGTALGMNESDADFWDIYEAIRDERRDYKDQAWDERPLAYGAGFVPGMLLGPSYSALSRVQTPLGRAGAAAGVGAFEGGLSASGNAEGGLASRLEDGATGAVLGAAIGPVTLPIANLVGLGADSAINLVNRARGKENVLNSGLEAMLRRAPQDGAAMRARLAEMDAANVPARLVDVVDESGRGVIRAAGSRMTPAREELARAADDVYVSAQDRVAEQARRNITSDPNTALQVSDQVKYYQSELGPNFEAVRDQPVEITEEIKQALSTPEARRVLRNIGRMMTPEERKSLNAVISALNKREYQNEEAFYENLIPGFSRMSKAAQDAIRRQVPYEDPLDNMTLTVDVVDKFARDITAAAKNVPSARRVAQKYAEILRGAARAQYPEYDKALIEYADLAKVGEAAEGVGRFDQTQFLRSDPYRFSQQVDAADTTPTVVMDGGDAPQISERDALTLRARDDVVARATEGSGAQAMSTARQLARGTRQQQRSRALLGADKADALAKGMEGEVRRVINTQYIDPRTGSQTQSRAQDSVADEFINMGADVATAGKTGLIRAARRWLRDNSIRSVDAERLVRDAISEDPARVRQAIDYLERRGVSRERAGSLMRWLSSVSAGRAVGGFVGSEQPRAAPNSIRAVMNRAKRVEQ